LISGAFPELMHAGNELPDGTVLDGEIVAWEEKTARPRSFAALQRRLNRKNVELSFWPDVLVKFVAFDLLELGGRDMRNDPLSDRRASLETLVGQLQHESHLGLSSPVEAATWEQLVARMDESRDRAVEGVMLKRRDSTYHAGRPTGPWWKLKVKPYTVDAVLIAAQPGTGKRAGLLTDYTFGVWDDAGTALVPVAKAYSGLTDAEISEMDRFVRSHTTGRFGPVHAVEPLRVFELGFEAIQRSDRHKSGIAVRFPRILRMRDDKKPQDADTIQMMRELLATCEGRG
jgi:DNA ligase-1